MAMKLRNKAVLALLKERFTPKEISDLFNMPVTQVTTLRWVYRDVLNSGHPIGSAEEHKPKPVKLHTNRYRVLSILQALGPMTAKEASDASREFGAHIEHTNVCKILKQLSTAGKVVKTDETPAVWSAP